MQSFTATIRGCGCVRQGGGRLRRTRRRKLEEELQYLFLGNVLTLDCRSLPAVISDRPLTALRRADCGIDAQLESSSDLARLNGEPINTVYCGHSISDTGHPQSAHCRQPRTSKPAICVRGPGSQSSHPDYEFRFLDLVDSKAARNAARCCCLPRPASRLEIGMRFRKEGAVNLPHNSGANHVLL